MSPRKDPRDLRGQAEVIGTRIEVVRRRSEDEAEVNPHRDHGLEIKRRTKRVVVDVEHDQDPLLRREILENVKNPGIDDPEVDQNRVEDTARDRGRGQGLQGNTRRSVTKSLIYFKISMS